MTNITYGIDYLREENLKGRLSGTDMAELIEHIQTFSTYDAAVRKEMDDWLINHVGVADNEPLAHQIVINRLIADLENRHDRKMA